mmetsp:Transcript_35604/g.75038  ORF Transcript_35604/g.75038 Transcript_35604/m.75038 type:complete len:342 (+) Transcript_35604:109-1134(+)|eukprot:CAMPEP_0183703010 /NCGR_PEP_ID=MMETSP0737-20130205/918_1 /TAXON_ID=385413 /ORGANISM="Thalassiosira miniscula, Strain CCMP1093" /LENGTH=341 /DNA_ID=CAMNT_0025929707 /DNA_START=43 /DNA_END=1068 /DNA_ORIENTATION=+
MATSAPSSPRKRVASLDINADDQPLSVPSTPSRIGIGSPRSGIASPRLGTNDIPRTYSGLYGAGAPPMPEGQHEDEDEEIDEHGNFIPSPTKIMPSASVESNLLPFELSRNRNTDWIAAGGPALLVTYILILIVGLFTILAFLEPKMAWAALNVIHGLVSIVYLHWIKGNPGDFLDGTQGEMNAMTCWEQIVCKPASHSHNAASPKSMTSVDEFPPHERNFQENFTFAIKKLRSRDVLCVLPTLLAHSACHVANYEFEYVAINIGMWAVLMLPKLPFMNGVRILGINRTTGIDDGDYLAEEQCHDTFDTEEESSKGSGVGLDFSDGGEDVDKTTDEPKKDR